ELEGITPGFAVKLGENEIKSVDDVAGLVPDDITGWREPGPDGKPVWQEGILKKGEMRKNDAQIFIMKARVIAGWIEPEALEQLEAEMAAEAVAEEMDLTEEERALLALGEIGKGGNTEAAAEDELMFDLDALAAEGDFEGGGDDAADKQ
ncbi:MAG: transcription termination/antitermination protein NusA, partial [Henriciella sp.]|nr:transcription termination/antitermination protein NusA [Henriciella sp.]